MSTGKVAWGPERAEGKGETSLIYADGHLVGTTTSGMYGHRLGASLGMGYIRLGEPVTAQTLANHLIEVEIGDRRVAATAQLGGFYDPRNERIRPTATETVNG